MGHNGEIDVPRQSALLFQYFNWVADHVQVNDNFNFIPGMLLQSNSRYYTKLAEKNYDATQYGLIKKGTTNVTPILEIV